MKGASESIYIPFDTNSAKIISLGREGMKSKKVLEFYLKFTSSKSFKISKIINIPVTVSTKPKLLNQQKINF